MGIEMYALSLGFVASASLSSSSAMLVSSSDGSNVKVRLRGSACLIPCVFGNNRTLYTLSSLSLTVMKASVGNQVTVNGRVAKASCAWLRGLKPNLIENIKVGAVSWVSSDSLYVRRYTVA